MRQVETKQRNGMRASRNDCIDLGRIAYAKSGNNTEESINTSQWPKRFGKALTDHVHRSANIFTAAVL